MAKGQVIRIVQETGILLDTGEVQDMATGKRFYFEAKRGEFKIGEKVEYDLAPGPAKAMRKSPSGGHLVKLKRIV